MLDEWNNSGEEIIPYVIGRLDYSDFDYYCNNLEVRDTSEGLVPDSTFFCLDEERNIVVGAVNIRHYLNIVIKWWTHRRWCSPIREKKRDCNKNDIVGFERMQKARNK